MLEKKQVNIAEVGLKTYLESLGYEVIDLRDNGGAFWLLGDTELSDRISLKEQNVHFSYAPNGSLATNKRPGWYSTYHG